MRNSAAVILFFCLPALAAAQGFDAATIKPSAPYGPQTRFGVSGGLVDDRCEIRIETSLRR